MTVFEYSGFDKTGARVSGNIEALNFEQAKTILKADGVLVKKVSEKRNESSINIISSDKLNLADIEFLTSELSLLLHSGLRIDKGVELLKNTTKKPAMHRLFKSISDDLRSGKQMSESLAKYPHYFDSLYVNLVSIGEATGNLALIFQQLSDNLSFRRDLQKRISQAITYPLVILFVCLSSIIFVFNYVVPNMAEIFEQQQNLPVYTRMLLSTSDWLQQYQLWLLVFGAISCLLVFRYKDHDSVKQGWQRLLIRLPVISNAVTMVDRIRFNSGLAMMLRAGLPVDQALSLASGNMNNSELGAELDIAINKIKRGEQLSVAFGKTRIYPDFFASLLSVGEESGELAKVFDEIAKRSQREYSDWVTRFTTLLEPVLILVMGGIVGSVVVIMMLSITNVSDVGL